MLSLPRQGFPVTCRIGHCCVCSPLALLFASDILCNSPTVNRGWIKLAQSPVTKNVGLQIFESASLQVCKSAVCVCRTPPERRDISCLFRIDKHARKINYDGLQTLQTSQIMCRSVFYLFLVCRKTSLQTMKAMRLLQTENRLCRR